MKKSRIAKFALLGASAAALAATLSTSTYAWYVSNQKANLENGSGTTGSAGADGSILLSWQSDATVNQWYKTLNFNDAPQASTVKGELQPLKYYVDSENSSNSGFYGIDANGAKDTTADTTHYIQFTLYVKTGKNIAEVTPTITFTSTKKASNVGQVAYVEDGYVAVTVQSEADFAAKKTQYGKLYTASTGENPTYTEASTYTASTNYFRQVVAGLPSASGTTENATPHKGGTFTVDALKSIYAQQKIGNATTFSYVAADATTTGGNAHDYWNAVTGKTMANAVKTTSAADASSSALAKFSLTANTPVALQYTIFLDGGDTDCFNSCQDWDISFELQFEITKETA